MFPLPPTAFTEVPGNQLMTTPVSCSFLAKQKALLGPNRRLPGSLPPPHSPPHAPLRSSPRPSYLTSLDACVSLNILVFEEGSDCVCIEL